MTFFEVPSRQLALWKTVSNYGHFLTACGARERFSNDCRRTLRDCTLSNWHRLDSVHAPRKNGPRLFRKRNLAQILPTRNAPTRNFTDEATPPGDPKKHVFNVWSTQIRTNEVNFKTREHIQVRIRFDTSFQMAFLACPCATAYA